MDRAERSAPDAPAGGSPAHAGMDPPRPRSSGRRPWLPRTRGDGPRRRHVWRGFPPAPPHTRGWTPKKLSVKLISNGSPAHAGMDPALNNVQAVSKGLPRTRGDGPTIILPDGSQSEAPPHTRGWTAWAQARANLDVGSPAHAGMDPCRLRRTSRRIRLPRTRGDGPLAAVTASAASLAPPHTRGWTRSRSRPTSSCSGSPAHAGMDPAAVGHAGRDPGLPRTRGDGPSSRPRPMQLPRAPPHTRGWTRIKTHTGLTIAGSPAHAGMDLVGAEADLPPVRLPRTRGDGPLADQPEQRRDEAPPHTRGWTLRP